MKASADLKEEHRIQMVDLVTQYREIAPEVQDAFDRILNASAFIGGSEVDSFSNELARYLDVPHVIPCANGTDALQIALMALGLERGDEVIVPAFTFIASAEVVALMGFTPVAIDVDPATFNLDTTQLEALRSERTKAIMPVHLFGQCCAMEPVLEFAARHGLYIVEDNAQSIGAQYRFADGTVKSAGAIGDIGTLSFYPSKNLGCYGDGGALYTQNADHAVLIRSLANHGMTRRYYHDHIGVNSRLDALQAAVLRIKLARLDTYITARQSAADRYDALLSDIDEVIVPSRASWSTHVFHQYTIRVPGDARNKLEEHLRQAHIPTMIYYPVPLHQQKAFDGVIRRRASLDHTEHLCRTVLSLPMHSTLNEDQIGYICDTIREFFRS